MRPVARLHRRRDRDQRLPGAGAIQSMATGPSHGLRRGYWSITGLEIGLMVQLALVAVGLGAAVAKSAVTCTVITWIGVVYLVYLAVRQWRTASRGLGEQLSLRADGAACSPPPRWCCRWCAAVRPPEHSGTSRHASGLTGDGR